MIAIIVIGSKMKDRTFAATVVAGFSVACIKLYIMMSVSMLIYGI